MTGVSCLTQSCVVGYGARVSSSLPALRILHLDEACAVVAKPAGMIVHRGWANDDLDLMRLTRDTLGKYVYPLHRLDRGASGAVLFAR